MQLRIDVFPALVAVAAADHPTPAAELTSSPATKGAHAVHTARVVVTGNRVIIAQDGPQGPTVIFSDTYKPESVYKARDPRNEESYLETEAGIKIAFRRDTNCGCGSRLKSWNPYKNMASSIYDPTE